MEKSGRVRTYVSGKRMFLVGIAGCLFAALGGWLLVPPVGAQTASAAPVPFIPQRNAGNQFEPRTDSFDYVRRDVMIPMRDGVKLHTVILVPKGANRAPILLTRTPYSADELTSHAHSSPSRPDPARLRQCHRRDRRRRLHPRGAGRARQVRLRGRLRDESPACTGRRIRRRSIMRPTPTTPSTGW